MRLTAFLLCLCSLSLPLRAAECGGEVACELSDGSYHIVLPEGPARGAVIFMHGYRGTSIGLVRNRGLVRQITGRGYALIAPQGLPRIPGRKGGSWNTLNAASRRNDVEFLAEVAADAADRFSLARASMLLAGFSAGGMMVWRVACDAPQNFTGYAPIAGLLWRPLPERCNRGSIQMLHVHGWSDPVVPLEGRSVAGGRITQGNLFVGLDILRDASGCIKDDPDSYEIQGGYMIRRWTSCAPGARLEFALHPGGHSIPKGWVGLALDWFESLPPREMLACGKDKVDGSTGASC